jgi:hypothetical protein
MSKYKDISSYRLAIKIRSHKTLLVEGISDKSVISHFLLSRNYQDNHHSDYFVDDASIVKQDNTLSGLGNKNKALAIINAINNPKLSGMIDREWDNINLNDLNDGQFIQNISNVYLTKGHSIENYWFDADASISFLIKSFPTTVNQDYLRTVSNCFPKILRFAAAYSLTAKDASIITRSSDLISHSDILWDNENLLLQDSFNIKLSERGVANCSFSANCNVRYAQLMESNQTLLKWICHGHLGEEAIRSCLAAVAMANGVDHATVMDIERGKKNEKFSHDSDYVCSQELNCVDPLDKILEWVRVAL